jgi:hypothetical protein
LNRVRLVFRVHAIERMFRRRISEVDVRHVLTNGEEIESYPEDTPYPSRLVLGWRGSRPIHVVAAEDAESPISGGEDLEVSHM